MASEALVPMYLTTVLCYKNSHLIDGKTEAWPDKGTDWPTGQ